MSTTCTCSVTGGVECPVHGRDAGPAPRIHGATAAVLALLAAVLLAGCDAAGHAPDATPATEPADGDAVGGMTGGGAR